MTVGFVACPMLFMKIYYDFFDMITIMKCRLHVIEIKVVNLIEMPGGGLCKGRRPIEMINSEVIAVKLIRLIQ